MAFHPRPQIASDLGRNVTRNFNPHRNRNQFPSGNEILAYGRRLKLQPASTRCDLRIASPTRQAAANRRIASHKATFAKLRGNVVRTFLGKSDFYWPLALDGPSRTVAMLGSVCQCPFWPEFCSYYVPTFFFVNGRVTNRRVPPFPKLNSRLLGNRRF